jgi:O-antigen ligase
MYDRLVAWKSALSTVPDFPLIGLGAGARHRSYYDNQYVMTLAESGLLGLGALLILLLGLAATLAQARRAWASPLGTGALAALAAVATHSMATGSLIVTMVGGPLFWVCGVAARMGARP